MTTISHIDTFCAQAASPVVAFIVPSQQHEKIFIRAAESLLGSKVTPVLLYPFRQEQLERNTITSFTVLPDEIPHIHSPDVLVTIDDPFKSYSNQCKVLCLPHAFAPIKYDGPPTPDALSFYGMLYLVGDYLFLPHAALSNFTAAELGQAFNNQFPDFLGRKERHFTVIPGGYLKNDLLMERMQQHPQIRDSILIMPTTIDRSGMDYVKKCQTMISTARKAAPSTRILFRPFPSDTNSEQVSTITAANKNDKLFSVDCDVNNIHAFSSATLLITDNSLGRTTFSLATALPHITYKPVPNTPSAQCDMGMVTHSEAQLYNAISTCVTHSAQIAGQISNDRDNILCNPGTAFTYLRECLEAIARDESKKEWITFEREYLKGEWSVPQEWSKALRSCHVARSDHVLRHFAQKQFPNDPRFSVELPKRGNVGLQIDYASRTFRVLSPDELNGFLEDPTQLPTYGIWGTSQGYKDTYQKMVFASSDQCVGFFDSNEAAWEKALDGKTIFAPSKLVMIKPEIIFIASHHIEPISFAIYELVITE